MTHADLSERTFVHNRRGGEGEGEGSVVIFHRDDTTQFTSLCYGDRSICGGGVTGRAEPGDRSGEVSPQDTRREGGGNLGSCVAAAILKTENGWGGRVERCRRATRYGPRLFLAIEPK